jgi:predicted ATPase
MRINWIKYENLDTGLKIEQIFFENLTLLVGASGAGKTQILKALEMSCNIATGKMSEAIPSKATLNFSIDKDEYEWSYAIKDAEEQNISSDIKDRTLNFQYEKLMCNAKVMFERDDKGKIFVKQYDSIPKPKQDESLISQYKADPIFEDVYYELSYLFESKIEMDIRRGISIESYAKLKNDIDAKKIPVKFFEMSKLIPPLTKFGIIKSTDKKVAQKIVDEFISIFPDVEDVDYIESKHLPIFCLSIKVGDNWIEQNDISSGMLKTFCYIVNIMTLKPGSVVLIDEFENGLGINCIDVISDLIMHERNDLQFIITSHHPYIINAIGMENWDIIIREKNVVASHTAKQLKLGASHHDAYIQLMNLLQDGVPE